ncbi:hypothetical protein [Nocardia cyriacigeorgica]|uniref:hypothetical protein n=1 Tax=Nocardia cyriacigeorgica TaxID=135487 RepID=UPI001107EDA9|nr:hypothetical protein [Nocardia cyriacigeorgica]TLF60798.1 hypothetical protein FEK31_03600 [Nocardia cyriacigeorgica]
MTTSEFLRPARKGVPPVTAAESPRPAEPDLRLSIFLHGQRFDYIACRTAAHRFILEWRARYHTDAVAVISEGTTPAPRLPCESLYLGP